MASPGHGILAMDESNATCGKRLDSIGLENTESNRRAYRELLVTTPGLGEYISGAILFEETLYQKTSKGPSMVDVLNKQGIVPGKSELPRPHTAWGPFVSVQSACLQHLSCVPPGLRLLKGAACKTLGRYNSVTASRAAAGIKVDKGLVPLANSNNESWCQGLDGLAQRCAEYYKAGARFAKWRGVVSIPAGPTMIAMRDTAYGLARYAAIAQVHLLGRWSGSSLAAACCLFAVQGLVACAAQARRALLFSWKLFACPCGAWAWNAGQ